MLTPVVLPSAVSGAALGSNKAAKGIKTESTPINFNATELHALPIGAEVMLSLPNAKQYVVIKESQTDYGGGAISWTGYLRDAGVRYKVIATTGKGGTFASIQTPDQEWSLVPGFGGGYDFLIDATLEAKKNPPPVDQNDYRISHESATKRSDSQILPATYEQNEQQISEIAQRMAAAAGGPFAKVTPTPQATVDVMVVVTQGFADFHGANMVTRINQLFATTNTAYATSESALRINRVGSILIKEYTDTAIAKDVTLATINNNSGVFADLEDTRSSVGADLVALLRNVNDGGIAYIGQISNIGQTSTTPETWNNPRVMYSVTGVCNFSGPGCDSIFAHELGHNMGLQHDRGNAGTALFGTRAYAFGWKINSGNAARDFRTIMSYSPPGNRILAFSNPNLSTCNPSGWAPTDACGVADSEDNARVLNENRFMVAAIKVATGLPVAPKLALSADRTRFPALSGTATVKVFRLGDLSSAVSVNYATANGTALAGTDFIATSGTLSWAQNDSASKTISITTLSSGAPVDRNFSVALSQATGPTGTAIAQPTVATLTLTVPGIWPPNNVLPVGWTQSAASNATWTVVDNVAYEGSFSLKSGAILDSQSASIQFTANMNTGNVRFYRRVSSELGYDFFRVFVDSVEFTSAAISGESDWTLINIPISAGIHTIKFSYVKDPSVSAGEDSAWIDQFSMPIATISPAIIDFLLD